ncbi:MAG: SM-20-related protein [Oceanicoccus sp.]|jgi:SM-20-related protein
MNKLPLEYAALLSMDNAVMYAEDINPSSFSVYEKIENDIALHGISVIEDALPMATIAPLLARVASLPEYEFNDAGTGRKQDHQINQFVRRDQIHWLDPQHPSENLWFEWMNGLKTHLNRSLMLGLFSYESHFAQYQPGAFYKKHVDAFKGQANRRLSTVLYLNPNWQPHFGGELVVYNPNKGEQEYLRINPNFGTLVVFLSEDFPHEVLPASHLRYSIAGWYRINNSIFNQIDPPQ